MITLNLKVAALFLNMHPQTLRAKAASGEIPGAKLSKSWVFLEEDLVQYIRSQYSGTGRASSTTGEIRCFTNETAVNITGADSRHRTERRYADLLKLPVSGKRKSLR
jgi:hypothetical protein